MFFELLALAIEDSYLFVFDTAGNEIVIFE